MKINKYIKWPEIWDDIDLEDSMDLMEDANLQDSIKTIRSFIKDQNVEMMADECYMRDDKLFFFFGETGGQNESDNAGWSRNYSFVVDADDLTIMSAEYEQG